MQYRFQKILKLCGIRKVPFHLLRHTYATDCIAHGFDAKTLSELLGHADASITLNRYVHSSMQMKQEYVKRLKLTGWCFAVKKSYEKCKKHWKQRGFLGLNGQWADFTKQKCFFPFSISSDKPSILLAFWDFLWYDGNREKKIRKGHITWFV